MFSKYNDFMRVSSYDRATDYNFIEFRLANKIFYLAQVFSCEDCEILKNTFFHRTPLVAGLFSLH